MDRLESGKKEQMVILLLVGILLLVIALPVKEPEQTVPETGESQSVLTADPSGEDPERKLEKKLRNMLAQVAGVGDCEVMISLKSEGRRIVEKDLEQRQSREERPGDGAAVLSEQAESSQSTVYQKDSRGNEIPYVTQQLAPEISGVLVIAQGGDNPVTVRGITEAVMALFGIEAHKIKVMKME